VKAVIVWAELSNSSSELASNRARPHKPDDLAVGVSRSTPVAVPEVGTNEKTAANKLAEHVFWCRCVGNATPCDKYASPDALPPWTAVRLNVLAEQVKNLSHKVSLCDTYCNFIGNRSANWTFAQVQRSWYCSRCRGEGLPLSTAGGTGGGNEETQQCWLFSCPPSLSYSRPHGWLLHLSDDSVIHRVLGCGPAAPATQSLNARRFRQLNGGVGASIAVAGKGRRTMGVRF
jgi:hypothetical protein